ncbi:MAG: hybrid sensor histidine kinase/response regulator [Flavobacteriales bacterium]|nr:hybrid sensor histidine kinase/response regulator [Flavobacteriales bacterium]
MNKSPVRILYLDDEEQNLIAFHALFRRDYEVFTTTSATEAVQILNQCEIHIIFSDQKMPDLSGVEFFEMIVTDFPEPIRILLTGYADIEAVIDAINKGQVYRYLTKPWIENELRITIEDAYEVLQTRRQVNDKQQALEKAYSELEKFVYSASHDLRAPLVSIKGILKLSKLENDPAKHTEYFNMIEQSVQKLDSFVQNIIHYYQNGKKEEILTAINFSQLADDVFATLAHYDGAERINLRKEIEPQTPFMADELRLRIVLNNLVSNALKFQNPKDEDSFVLLSIHNTVEKAVIKVADNGIGISPDDLPHVFDMFYRTSQKNIGTGIGLYIVKEAVEKLGGKITVTSDLDNGTCFLLEIPNKS